MRIDYQATMKEVKRAYRDVIQLPYCALQHAFRETSYDTKVCYTCGIYGWNASVYEVDGVALVTGYRPFGNIKPSYETIREFEQAEARIDREIVNPEARKKAFYELLRDFVGTCKA